MKKYKRGFTSGVYDMFHIGHLNVIKNAKCFCEELIVGVSSDEVVIENKNKNPIIPFEERIKIVESIRYVDRAVSQESYSIEGKIETAQKYGIDVMFVGDDWKDTPKWNEIEKRLKAIDVDVVYLPHTDGISSTILRNKIGVKNV